MKRKEVEAGKVTVYAVQAFDRTKRGWELPVVRPAQDKAHAERLGARLADTYDGSVVFCRQVDEALGDYDDVVVLAKHGDLPPNYDELLFT